MNLSQQLNKLAEAVARDRIRNEVEALSRVHLQMTKRIFGEGKDGIGFDIEDRPLGEYSPQYGQRRRRLGKGNNLGKNLVFTGALRQSIQVGQSGEKNVIGYTDPDLKDIANFQETSKIQVNRPIFGLQIVEKEEGENLLKQLNQRTITECLKQK